MMKPTTIERKSLLTCVNDDDNGEGLGEGLGAVANYCEKKSSSSNLWSPLEIIDSLSVAPFETDRSKSSYEEGCARENANENNAPSSNSFDDTADIQQLAKRALVLCTPSKVGGKARVSPMKEYIASFYNDREYVRTVSQQLAAGAKKSQGTVLRQQQQQQEKQRTPLSKKSQVVLSKQQERTSLLSKSKVVGGSAGSKISTRVASVPDEKYAFQDKENCEGNIRRSIDTKNKKKKKKNNNSNSSATKINDNNDNEGNLRTKLVKSQKRISGLQAEVKRKDEELLASQNVTVEKVKELDEMSTFMISLQDLLEEMGCSNIGILEKLDAVDAVDAVDAGVVATKLGDDADEQNTGLEEKNKKRENEWKITQLVEALESQGNVMDSLKVLNDDYEKTALSMMQLIHEKDEALAQIEHVTTMNEHANRKIIMHTQEQHQKSMNETGMKHQRQMAELLESLTNQTNLIDSLKCLTVDSSHTIASLTCLIDEKDKALAAFSHFNELNNHANRKLLTHAKEKHQEEMLDQEMHTKNLHLVIRSQLKEKVIRHKELALLKLRMEGTTELKEQYSEEAAFIAVALAISAVSVASVWQRHEWLLFVWPVYFLFVFWKLG